MANWFTELTRDLVDPTSRLSDILRKGLLLADELDSDELRAWIRSEQTGYRRQEDAPEYRQVPLLLYGTFKLGNQIRRNVPINPRAFDQTIRESLEEFRVNESTSALEQMIESGQTEFALPLYPEVAEFLSGRIYANAQCLQAEIRITPGQIRYILDETRNRFLSLLSSLRKAHPELLAGPDSLGKVPPVEIQKSVEFHIYGGMSNSSIAINHSKASATVTTTTQAEGIELLIRELRILVSELPNDARSKATAAVDTFTAAVSDQNAPRSEVVRAVEQIAAQPTLDERFRSIVESLGPGILSSSIWDAIKLGLSQIS